MRPRPLIVFSLFVILSIPASAAPAPLVLNVWPGTPPGETKPLPPEGDTTREDGRMVGGRRVIRIGNVSTPQLAVYQPARDKASGAAVVICPGGGFNILAYDLEGTEVAAWLTCAANVHRDRETTVGAASAPAVVPDRPRLARRASRSSPMRR